MVRRPSRSEWDRILELMSSTKEVFISEAIETNNDHSSRPCFGIVNLMLSYVLTAALVIATPGADVLLAMATSLASGAKAGLAAVLGMASGYLIHAGAAGLGLAALLASSKNALTYVEIAGATYLFLAGISQLRHPHDPPQAVTALITPLRRGFITSVLNPKGTVFFLAFLPRFLPREASGADAFGLGLIFSALTIGIYGAYVLAANRARRFLSGPGTTARLRTVAGIVFIGFAVSIATKHL